MLYAFHTNVVRSSYLGSEGNRILRVTGSSLW